MKIAQGLFIVKSLFLFLAGTMFYIRHLDSITMSQSVSIIICVLIIIDGLIHLFFAWAMGKRIRLFYYAVFPFLFTDIFLTITDQLGFYDFIYLATSFAIIYLLWKAKNEFCNPTLAERN